MYPGLSFSSDSQTLKSEDSTGASRECRVGVGPRGKFLEMKLFGFWNCVLPETYKIWKKSHWQSKLGLFTSNMPTLWKMSTPSPLEALVGNSCLSEVFSVVTKWGFIWVNLKMCLLLFRTCVIQSHLLSKPLIFFLCLQNILFINRKESPKASQPKLIIHRSLPHWYLFAVSSEWRLLESSRKFNLHYWS